jgi:hypothetical protein
MKRILLIGCVAWCMGCTRIETPSGYSYWNFGFEKRFQSLDIVTTNGASLRVKGWTSEASTIAGAVAEGVAKGIK